MRLKNTISGLQDGAISVKNSSLDFVIRFFYFIFFSFPPSLTSPPQGNKCKECSYASHFKCRDKIGSTCLSEYTMNIWKRREVLEIVTIFFRRVCDHFNSYDLF